MSGAKLEQFKAAKAETDAIMRGATERFAAAKAELEACAAEAAAIEADTAAAKSLGDFEKLELREKARAERARAGETRLRFATASLKHAEGETGRKLAAMRDSAAGELRSELKLAEADAASAARDAAKIIASRALRVREVAERLAAVETDVARALGDLSTAPIGTIESAWSLVPGQAEHEDAAAGILIGAGNVIRHERLARGLRQVA